MEENSKKKKFVSEICNFLRKHVKMIVIYTIIIATACYIIPQNSNPNSSCFYWVEDICSRIDTISLICLIFIVSALLIYYFNEFQSKKKGIFEQIGYDISNLIAWIFSVNGLFALLVCTVIVLVGYMITQAKDLSHSGSSDVLQLLTVTLTVALSTLIPTLVSRMVSRNQVHELVEKKVDGEVEKYKTSLNEIRKDKGHSCRMSATMLEQLAHSNINKLDTTYYAAWSIGWAASAIIQYLLILPHYENARKNSAYCLNVINKAGNDIKTDATANVKFSDFQSFLTMHALMTHYNLILPLQSEAIAMRSDDSFESSKGGVVQWEKQVAAFDDIFIAIESWLYNHLEENDKRAVRPGFCQITGMQKEFNDQLDKYVIDIIEKLNDTKETQQNNNRQSKNTNEPSTTVK